MVQVWLEVFWKARSAATWPAPWLSGTTRQVPEGISAVVHADPAACVGGAEEAEEAAVLGDESAAEEEVDVDPDAVLGFTVVAGEDVSAAELELPDTAPPVAAPALLPEVLEHPAVSAAAPSAPAANKTEIRFMEPILSG